MKKIVCVFVSFFLIASSCNKTENQVINQVVNNTPSTINLFVPLKNKIYKGEDLFRGIFLQQGEVSQLVSEIFTYEANITDFVQSIEEKNKIKETQEKIIYQIKQSNPSFMEEFGKNIQSGNHLLVKNAIDKAAESFYKSMMMLPEFNKQNEIAKTNEILKDLDISKFTENNKINRKKLES